MISYGKQTIDQSDIEAVVEVLKGDWLSSGPAVKSFEDNLAHYFGSKFACAVSNGTASLHLTGLALGWQTGDIVITTPLTFLATANCIIYSNATPDFVDIDPESYTIDVNQLEDKIKTYLSKGLNVKAVIGVDFAGHPCDWNALRKIKEKYKVQLVNDNCHAMGSSYCGDKQYAVKYSDVVTQSYHPVKHITTGEGGVVLTNNPEVDEKVRRLRNHGMTKAQNQLEKNDGPWYYEMHDVGFNYRLTDFQSAIGSSQLKRLDEFVQRRRQIAQIYNESFFNIDRLTAPAIHHSVAHSYHLYPLCIRFDDRTLTKKDFFARMKEAGINLQVHYIPVHLQPFYRKKFGFKHGDFPVSESFYESAASMPVYPRLSDKDVDFTVNHTLQILR